MVLSRWHSQHSKPMQSCTPLSRYNGQPLIKLSAPAQVGWKLFDFTPSHNGLYCLPLSSIADVSTMWSLVSTVNYQAASYTNQEIADAPRTAHAMQNIMMHPPATNSYQIMLNGPAGRPRHADVSQSYDGRMIYNAVPTARHRNTRMVMRSREIMPTR
jgi:hypothetical protein